MEMLKVSQVAERLNCSISTVYSLVESGKLGHHRCPGIRVSDEQLASFLDGTEQEPGTLPRSMAKSQTSRSASGSPVFKHLDPARLAAAWREKGVS
jgi:excisionase family DNA binding protein